jgi:precorrin-6B methylase 2
MNSFQEINRRRGNFFWHLVDIFSGTSSIVGTFYEHYIGKEYERENKQFNLHKNQSFLHIGCGAYPITAIILEKYVSGPIVAIDKNPFVVAIAQNIIKKKKLQDKILIKQGDGSEYNVSNFDTIIISSCSIPKEKIVDNVFNNAKPSSTIIVRELFSEIQTFKNLIQSYNCINQNGEIDCRVFPKLHWRSYCFIVKK